MGHLKNHWINTTRLVCTHSNSFLMLNSNITAIKIQISRKWKMQLLVCISTHAWSRLNELCVQHDILLFYHYESQFWGSAHIRLICTISLLFGKRRKGETRDFIKLNYGYFKAKICPRCRPVDGICKVTLQYLCPWHFRNHISDICIFFGWINYNLLRN